MSAPSLVSAIIFNLVMVIGCWRLSCCPMQQIEQFYATAWLAFAVSVAGFIQLVLTATVWLSTGSRWQRARTLHVRSERKRFSGVHCLA